MSLKVKVEGDHTGFKQMLEHVREEARAFSNELGKGLAVSPISSFFGGLAGGLGFEGLKSAFEGFMGRAANLRETSEQLEMSAAATQKWAKAADQLNISFGTVQTALNAIRDARYQALFDPKAASIFDRLGISRRDVLNAEGLDASEFAAKVMRAGMGSETGRSILTELLGRRGLRALPASKIYGEMVPDFDQNALDTAAKAERAQKRFGNWRDRQIGQVVSTYTDLADQFRSKGFWAALGERIKLTYSRMGPSPAEVARAMGDWTAGAAVMPQSSPQPEAAKDIHDPLISVRLAKEQEQADRRAKSEEAVRNVQRQTMTIEDRRISIQQELLRLRRQAEDVESRTMPENLKSQEEIAEWQEKQAEKLDEIKAKEAAYHAQLRVTPERIGADSMARIGLFSASTVNFNPAIGIAQQQLQALHQIARNTQPKPDPFQR